jgi:hypothetical protein
VSRTGRKISNRTVRTFGLGSWHHVRRGLAHARAAKENAAASGSARQSSACVAQLMRLREPRTFFGLTRGGGESRSLQSRGSGGPFDTAGRPPRYAPWPPEHGEKMCWYGSIGRQRHPSDEAYRPAPAVAPWPYRSFDLSSENRYDEFQLRSGEGKCARLIDCRRRVRVPRRRGPVRLDFPSLSVGRLYSRARPGWPICDCSGSCHWRTGTHVAAASSRSTR